MSTDPMQRFGKEGMDMAMKAFGAWSRKAQGHCYRGSGLF